MCISVKNLLLYFIFPCCFYNFVDGGGGGGGGKERLFDI